MDAEAGDHLSALRRAWQITAIASSLNIPTEIAKLAASQLLLTGSHKQLEKLTDTEVTINPIPVSIQVVVMQWEESERGWGVRPDGYSIHPNQEDYKSYLAAHWARLPAEAPDEYERPAWSNTVTHTLPSDHPVALAMLEGERRVYRSFDEERGALYRAINTLEDPKSSARPGWHTVHPVR